jgi:hypothetical protein
MLAIVEDARHPAKYRMLLSLVDVIFSDVAQPDQARIVALNADYFLKNQGYAVISIKANCIDSTMPAEQVFANEVQLLKTMKFKPTEQLTLEPYERVSGTTSWPMLLLMFDHRTMLCFAPGMSEMLNEHISSTLKGLSSVSICNTMAIFYSVFHIPRLLVTSLLSASLIHLEPRHARSRNINTRA